MQTHTAQKLGRKVTPRPSRWEPVLHVKRFFYQVAVGIVACLLAASASAQLRVGEVAEVSIETPHPYPHGAADRPAVWTHTIHHPGAAFLKLHFATFAVAGVVENGTPQGDYVTIRDGNGAEREVVSGILSEDWWTRSVPGDTLTVELHADAEENAAGLVIDSYGYGTVPLYPQRGAPLPSVVESICGKDNKAPVCKAKEAERIRLSDAVGRLLFANDCGGLFVCTGFLFATDGKFMTNAHCADSAKESKSMEVWFNYVDDATPAGVCSLNRPNPDIFQSKKFLLKNCDLDVAIHLIQDPVKGNPADIYGFLPLSERVPAQGEPVWVPQHPLGQQKALSEAGATVATASLEGINFCADLPSGCFNGGFFTGTFTEFGYTADTQPGSSGSPVLDANNQVIGLHHAGGCTAAGGENAGVVMSSIVDSVLPLLGKAPKAKVLTDPKKRKGEAPFSVTFDGSRSVDPDGGNIVEYQWDFGDGSAEVAGPEAVVTHIYTGPGSFSATLQVIDDEGTQSKKAATRRIIVKE